MMYHAYYETEHFPYRKNKNTDLKTISSRAFFIWNLESIFFFKQKY